MLCRVITHTHTHKTHTCALSSGQQTQMLKDGFGVERCVGVARCRAERPSCEHSPALGVDNLCPPSPR